MKVETELLKDYKKMLTWLFAQEKMIEYENMMIDERLTKNENLLKKFLRIEKEVNEFYVESGENAKVIDDTVESFDIK